MLVPSNPYNPFSFLFAPRYGGTPLQNPYSRILTSTFTERIYDTFYVFSGDIVSTVNQIHPPVAYGILDYLGFAVASLLRTGQMYITNHASTNFFTNCLVILFCIPLVILQLALYIIDVLLRQAIAGVLTAAVTITFLPIVHAVCSLICFFLEKNVINLAKKELPQINSFTDNDRKWIKIAKNKTDTVFIIDSEYTNLVRMTVTDKNQTLFYQKEFPLSQKDTQLIKGINFLR